MTDQNSRSYCMTSFNAPLEEVHHTRPSPKGEEVLVHIKGAGVCHSDLHIQDGYYDMGLGEKISFEGRIAFPFTPGHEVAGRIEAVGPDAVDVEIGKNVLVCPWVGCGSCAQCITGHENLCAAPRFIGVNAPGGYSDYVIVPHSRYLIDIGDIDPAVAAPLACSGITTYSAIKKFGAVLASRRLVIFGAGGLGLMAIGLMAKMDLMAPVVVELDESKRKAAMAAGAHAVVDARSESCADDIRAMTEGSVLEILDLVGASETASLGFSLLDKGGQMVIVGLLGGDMRLPVPSLPMRAITLQGSYIGTPAELRELVALVREKGVPDLPIDKRPLCEADNALNDLRAGQVVGRVVLVP